MYCMWTNIEFCVSSWILTKVILRCTVGQSSRDDNDDGGDDDDDNNNNSSPELEIYAPGKKALWNFLINLSFLSINSCFVRDLRDLYFSLISLRISYGVVFKAAICTFVIRGFLISKFSYNVFCFKNNNEK